MIIPHCDSTLLQNIFQKTHKKNVDYIQIFTAKKSTHTSRVAQSCYSVIGDKPFLWSKPKLDPP